MNELDELISEMAKSFNLFGCEAETMAQYMKVAYQQGRVDLASENLEAVKQSKEVVTE